MDKYRLDAFLNALPKIEYLEEDYLEIPGTRNRLVPKDINRKGLTAYVRRMTRKGVNLEWMSTLNKKEVKRTAEKNGLKQELIKDRVRSAILTERLNEIASWFQKRLLEAEYPNGFPKTEGIDY
tara:strand:+ start:89 stop:460 length:372 start_codon:yes stop_codon:yes gene_type:complete